MNTSKTKIDKGYIKEGGEPLKCDYCDSTDLHTQVTDVTAGHVCEKIVSCKLCFKEIGHWAYGNWEPM